MKKFLLLIISFAVMANVMSQSNKCWSAHTSTEKIITDKSVARLSFPKTFKLYDLNLVELRQQLFSVVNNATAHSTIISLPNADGNIESFEVYEASNFEPALQARFPEIRAFSGKGLTDKYATLKLSISPQGIQTMVFRTDKPNEFIEPYSNDHAVYAVFYSQRQAGQLPWTCSTVDQQLVEGLSSQVTQAGITARSGGDLKTMRLAQSCNAEYSNYFGATSAAQVGLVLAAFNNTLTRCNGVYEKDLALHLNLISNTTSVIYYVASSDPYTTTLSSWNAQLQSTLTSVIGEANYDIGHMFGSTGGGGNAGCIGCVCTNGSKGSGITSPADGIPQGDNFDIDYVVHEVGHQLGANHTFSMSNEGTGVNKEPGSGMTIMGYAGITAQDMSNHSIDIYHQASIAQIQANLATKTCPVTTSIAATNATPVLTTVPNYTIPISTPFALTGVASDANGDALTYCWEQNDNASTAQTGASSLASATKATGPNWISFSPTASPTRYFPKLATILAGGLISGPLTGGDAGANTEALSSVSRTLNFRLTVRDNSPYSSTAPIKVGQTQFSDMVVTVSSTSGPFAVTAPNTAVTWAGGSTQNITWSVANTTLAPVSCANVKISLSTDGGLTFPTVLVASTPNDGTEALVIPSTPSTTARIKIESVGNIFFDISNTNFTIGAAIACGDAAGLTSSAIGNNSATISWSPVTNALSYAVDYKLNSSATWTSFATAQTATTASLTGLIQGSLYDWRVRATCTAGTGNYVSAQFTTTIPCGVASGLTATAITSTSATLGWAAVTGATSYNVQYRIVGAAAWTSTTSTINSRAITGLTASSNYEFQVQTVCVSGTSAFTASTTFTTSAPPACNATSGLTASAITATSATLGWAAVTGAVSYNVQYRIVGAAAWTSATSATNSVAISGLTASSNYEFQVQTVCSAGSSAFTASATFATTAPSTCSNNFESNNTSATATLLTANTSINSQIATASDVDWYSFTTATPNTNIKVALSNLAADYDVSLYNSALTLVGSSANTGTTAEQIISNTATAGTYYVKVSGFNSVSLANYNFTAGTAAAATVATKLTASSVSQGNNNGTTTLITSTSASNYTGASGTNNAGVAARTGALNTAASGSAYFQITLTPSTGNAISVTGLSFGSRSTGTGPLAYAVRSSVDNYATNIATGTLTANNTWALKTNTGLTFSAPVETAVTFRIYGYNGTGAPGANTANWRVDDITFTGSVNGFNATQCYALLVNTGATTFKQVIPVATTAGLSIFPNPAYNQINLNIADELNPNCSIVILDSKGVAIKSQKMQSKMQQVDIATLGAGFYLVKVINGTKVMTQKFIKQ